MKFNPEHFEEGFYQKEFPFWICPTCLKGQLRCKYEELRSDELSLSKKRHKHEEWGAEFAKLKFTGNLYCNNSRCEEVVTIAGRMGYEYVDDAHGEVPKYFPEYFYPYLKIFELPEGCPYEVEQAIENVSKLFWLSKSGCANAIGVTLEEILTDQRINRFVITKKRERKRLSLNERIKLFEAKKPVPAKFALAIKFVRNEGSHSLDLTNDGLLDGIKLLHKVIYMLYSDDDKDIHSIARDIIKAERPIS